MAEEVLSCARLARRLEEERREEVDAAENSAVWPVAAALAPAAGPDWIAARVYSSPMVLRSSRLVRPAKYVFWGAGQE